MKTAKGGLLYKAIPPTEGALGDAARLQQILEVNFDAGYLFGPARAETWKDRGRMGPVGLNLAKRFRTTAFPVL